MKKIILNKKISTRVEDGHPWVFANEVNTGKALDAAAKPGEIVEVLNFEKKIYWKGVLQPPIANNGEVAYP
jgi:23S rRNA (cytosine1962-C5)-methyltransferase